MDYNLFHTRCKLNHLNIPRFFEGFVFLRLQKNYQLYRNNKTRFAQIDALIFYIFKFIQKIYPKNIFQNLQI